jgi:hypothetical protein
MREKDFGLQINPITEINHANLLKSSFTACYYAFLPFKAAPARVPFFFMQTEKGRFIARGLMNQE